MRTVERWFSWISQLTIGEVLSLGTAVGSAAGFVAGWFGTRDIDRLGRASVAAAAGAAVGIAIAPAARWLCGVLARRSALLDAQAGVQLFGQLRNEGLARVRRQRRVLLDGGERLDIRFSGYRRIAPPRSFTGAVRQRKDLVAALDAAAAPERGPRLLIVGPPGHGKTVALLELAHHLAETHGDRFGAPWVFNLGSWTSTDDDLTRWIVRELCATTGPLPDAEETVTGWMEAGWIAPVLDGLDEIVDPDTRRRCAQAINAFIDHVPSHTALVVASRPGEYTEITSHGADRLAVNAAIALDKLDRSVVATRLHGTEAGVSLAHLIATDPDHPVAEVLRVPLWLGIATTLNNDRANHLATLTRQEDAQHVLAEAYLDHAITQLDQKTSLGTDTCRRTLAAIAGFLAHPHTPNTTTFYLENLTPKHANPTQSRQFAGVVGLALGMGWGLAGELSWGLAEEPTWGLGGRLVWGLTAGLGGGLLLGLSPEGTPAHPRFQWPGIGRLLRSMANGLAFGLTAGLASGLAWNLAGWPGIGLSWGLIGGLWTSAVGLASDAGPAHPQFQWPGIGRLITSMAGWVAVGLALGLTGGLAGLTVGVTAAPPFGLAYGLALGLALALDQALITRERVVGERVDQGRKGSRTSVALRTLEIALAAEVAGVLAGGLAFGLTFGLTWGPVLALPFGLTLGLTLGLDDGGWYLVMQRRVRRWATQQAMLPSDIVGFLHAAADAGVLRRTCGGMQFRHRTFIERLANEATNPGLFDLHQRVGTA